MLVAPTEEDHDPSVPADTWARRRGLRVVLLHVSARAARRRPMLKGNPLPRALATAAAARSTHARRPLLVLMSVVFVHCAEEDNDYAVSARARPHCDRLRL